MQSENKLSTFNTDQYKVKIIAKQAKDHDLSAHSIKRNNAFHKQQDQKTSAIAVLIKSNVCS